MRGVLLTGLALVALAQSADGADLSSVPPTKAPPIAAAPGAYDWTGFYVGAHLGYAAGWSDWSATPVSAAAPTLSGSFSLFQPYDAFTDSGSYFGGVQAGYNDMLPNRFVIGGEADVSFPAFPNLASFSIGGSSGLVSPAGRAESYGESARAFGTLRGRIGYAPGNWLIYATGGFAWSYDQRTLTQLASGATESPFLWRFGYAAGAGVEAPVIPHWTARLEYLFTSYGNSSASFPIAGERFTSNWSMQELRAGLNYHFGGDPAKPSAASQSGVDMDDINVRGQSTLTWQGYPSFRSPYAGPNSLPGAGEGRETFDATLYAGVGLWQGAQLWINPELDQGFGLGDTHGIAGFTSAEAYKIGADYPYARLQRAFIRETIDLGGKSEKVDADINQFAGTQTANRLVLTFGRFSVVDIFDTNKYANNPKSDFLNWSLINAGTFDYAADGWGYTLGGAAEWYQGDWTLRGGVFDLSTSPTGGISPDSLNLDPTFGQFELAGEVERRYELWGQPGSLKVTGFLNRGRAGYFADAIALAAVTGGTADINAVRTYDSRPGVSVNLQQQVTETVGVFARAGWADGSVEPWDFADIDRTVSGGVSINGKQWDRPDDTVGIAGVVNGISKIHEEFLNDGGLGILVGDGMLPHPGPEQILETYYNYALSSSTHLTADYQFVVNPGYNEDRGPVSVFSTRVHYQF
ncbi:MAG: carbohydrate porin [Xanthobacteraceae bacterium]